MATSKQSPPAHLTSPQTVRPLGFTARGVLVAFAVSGVIHLVRPRTFKTLMPSWVPAHREVILGSGVAELACAAGLALRPTRRVAGPASALLLAAVFPGNVKMAVDARRSSSPALRAVAYARLPLQWVLIRAVRRAGR